MELSAPRLVSLSSQLLTVFLVYIFGRRWKEERTGRVAAGILLTSFLFLVPALFQPNGGLAPFWLTLAMYACVGILIERQPLRLGRFALLLALGSGGAIATRSWLAAILPLSALGLALTYTKSWGQMRRIAWGKPALVTGTLATAGAVFSEKVLGWTVSLGPPPALSQMPRSWFLPLVGVAFLPWSVFVPSTLGLAFTDEAIPMKRDPVKALLILWSMLAAVLLSLIPGHAIADARLLMPALALLCGNTLADSLNATQVPAWLQTGLLGWTALLCGFVGLIKLHLTAGDSPHGWGLSPAVLGALGINGSTVAMLLSIAVMILIGVWGMRQARASITGLFAVQILLIGAMVGLLSAVSFGQSSSTDPELSDLELPKLVLPADPPPQLRLPDLIVKKDEWKGVQCGVQDPRVAVFRHADKWTEFWQKAMAPFSERLKQVPTVDFEKEMVVGVFGGSKTTPNFEIELKKMQVAGDVLVVRYKEIKKMQGVFSPPFTIQPFHLKKIPLFPGEVKFEEKR